MYFQAHHGGKSIIEIQKLLKHYKFSTIFFLDGKMITLDNAWQLFQFNKNTQYSREEMLSILTQMEHPVKFKPFMCLHPCRTSEILAQTPLSKNRILTFISVMGPYLQLHLDNDYGLECLGQEK